MKEYTFVDADAHVEECEDTWKYLDPEYQPRRPVLVTVNQDKAPSRGNLNAFWVIDGRAMPQPTGRGASFFIPGASIIGQKKSFSLESQELRDIGARLQDMDKLGIDLQVVFPTIFIFSTTDDPQFEAALHRSYNTWMAQVCSPAADRVKWNAAMPIQAVDEAVKEVKRAKELGAAGAVIYGSAGDKLLHDPSLDPFYAALCEANLPLCIHFGGSFPALSQACDEAYGAIVIGNTAPVVLAFFSIVGGGVLDRFPDLRVGFFEWGSQWIPYLVDRMDHYYHVFKNLGFGRLPKKEPHEYLRNGNLYVTSESEDRLLPEVLEIWGEDRVMLSSDMPHVELRDNAKVELMAREDLDAATKRKLLVDNPLRFYGLS